MEHKQSKDLLPCELFLIFCLFGCLAPASLLIEPGLLKLLPELISLNLLGKDGDGWISCYGWVHGIKGSKLL